MDQKREIIYVDTMHGIKAKCKSRTIAWGLIRNECHKLGVEVPTFDKIVRWEQSKT